MKPEQQRAAIAKKLGWKYHGPEDMQNEAWACWSAPDSPTWELGFPPDFLNDLNAMHKAEEVIIQRGLMDGFDGYSNTLCEIMDNGNNVRATAAQRAEAFLRTLNLWNTP